MKNLKIALVAAILIFASVSYGTSRPDRPERIQTLSLKQAMANPGLVQAMHQQLEPALFSGDQSIHYAIVEFEGKTYSIYGTWNAWRSFFMRDLRVRPDVVSRDL